MKIFKKTHAFEKNKDSLTKEYNIMQGLNHKNLVNFIEILPDADYIKKDKESYKCMAIVIEYAAGGELFEYVA